MLVLSSSKNLRAKILVLLLESTRTVVSTCAPRGVPAPTPWRTSRPRRARRRNCRPRRATCRASLRPDRCHACSAPTASCPHPPCDAARRHRHATSRTVRTGLARAVFFAAGLADAGTVFLVAFFAAAVFAAFKGARLFAGCAAAELTLRFGISAMSIGSFLARDSRCLRHAQGLPRTGAVRHARGGSASH